VISHG